MFARHLRAGPNRETTARQVRTFTYDPLDRVTNADYNGATAVAYTYDAYGRPLHQPDS